VTEYRVLRPSRHTIGYCGDVSFRQSLALAGTLTTKLKTGENTPKKKLENKHNDPV